MLRLMFAAVVIGALPASASADSYIEYPAPEAYPLQRSTLTPEAVVIPPYDQAFRVRVYTTPPRQPFYNLPPYAVITPY